MKVSARLIRFVVLLVIVVALINCKPEGNVVLDPKTGALVSPIHNLTQFMSVLPNHMLEPTVPPLPTLTPPPTLPPEPTQSGTPITKYGPTPLPTPTRHPLLLTPTPVGTPPSDLQALYYVADNNGTPELRVIGIDTQGRKWSETSVVGDQPLLNVWGLYTSPNGKYLAVEVAYTGEMESLKVYMLERNTGRIWCPLEKSLGCSGSFWGWTLDDRALIHPFNPSPDTLRVPGGAVLVDLNTGEYDELDLPVHPQWGYSLANWVAVSPYTAKIAYSITYSEGKEDVSEIWIAQLNGQDKQLIRKVRGAISTVSWSPAGKQLIYFYQPRIVDSDPSELWLLNSDGSGAKLLTNKIRGASEWRYRPSWSPDGRYVAFVQVDDPAFFLSDWREPGTNLFAVDTITGQITRLSSFKNRNVAFPTWSPDGKYVAFVSSIIAGESLEGAVPQYAEVWVARADGSQLYVVSERAQWRNALAWLPSMPSMQEK